MTKHELCDKFLQHFGSSHIVELMYIETGFLFDIVGLNSIVPFSGYVKHEIDDSIVLVLNDIDNPVVNIVFMDDYVTVGFDEIFNGQDKMVIFDLTKMIRRAT